MDHSQANNMVIHGALEFYRATGRRGTPHFIISDIEHDAVEAPIAELERRRLCSGGFGLRATREMGANEVEIFFFISTSPLLSQRQKLKRQTTKIRKRYELTRAYDETQTMSRLPPYPTPHPGRADLRAVPQWAGHC